MIQGRFRADPYKNYVAVLFVAVLIIRALLFGLDIRVPDFQEVKVVVGGRR